MLTWRRTAVVTLAVLIWLTLLGLSQRFLVAHDAPGEEGPFLVTPADPPSPVVALRVRVPACATAGQELEYHICVENVSKAAAHHVLVRNPVPANAKLVCTKPEADVVKNEVVWALGTLEPGACCDLVLVLCPTGAGDVKSCARVQFEHGQCVTTHVPRPKSTRMDVIKTGPAQRNVSRPATYQITVSNPGETSLADVVVTDPVPEKTTFVSASAGGQMIDGAVRWSLGDLEPGARRTVQVVLKAKETGEIVNRVTAASGSVSAEAEAKTLFEGGSGLTADVDDRDDPLEVGAQTVYTVTVLNQGAVAAKQVVVVATVPDQLEVKGVDGPSAAKEEGQKVSFAPITVQPKAEAVYKITVVARKPGDVRFRVDLSADPETLPSGLPVRREESTTIYDPNLPNAPPLAEPQARRKTPR